MAVIKNILAADDERPNLILLNRILSPEYNLVIAKTGGEALLRADNNTPDLVFLDIMLPDMSGFDVLRELKRQPKTQNIPVIFITGLDGGDYEKTGLELGASGFIKKPFSAEAVLSCVKTQIGGAQAL